MEQNKLEIAPKKFYKIMRVLYSMLRKGISKLKLLADLNIMISRNKLADKLSSIQNLIFQHHHPATSGNNCLSYRPVHEYKLTRNFNTLNKRNKHKYTPTHDENNDQVLSAVALEMAANSVAASPALPGFGRTPTVRQLRVTDSPFPLSNAEEEDTRHVDEAAEEFIKRFHRDLFRQQHI